MICLLEKKVKQTTFVIKKIYLYLLLNFLSLANSTYNLLAPEPPLGDSLKFFFISEGVNQIVKAIEYSYVTELEGKKIYNLAFGDYDYENDKIIDDTKSSNGDVYKVFNTVLSTIPQFFEHYKDCVLMVHGSDGRPEFIENCRKDCTKNCKEECKNFNRRINIYSTYVNRNYDTLTTDFEFTGGIRNQIDGKSVIKTNDYIKGFKYDSVFLSKKNL